MPKKSKIIEFPHLRALLEQDDANRAENAAGKQASDSAPEPEGGEEIYLAGAAGHRAADRLAVQGSHALYGRGTDDADSHRVVHHASIRAAAHVSSFPRLSSILCGFSAVGF